MNFKSGILIIGMLALMTSCGKSVQERAWEEYENEVDKALDEFDREMEKLEREMDNW